MNPVGATGHAKPGEKAEDTNRTRFVEPWQLQLYLKTLHHISYFAGHLLVLVIRPVVQAIAMELQGCPIKCVVCLHDSYQRFWQMHTTVAGRFYQMMTADAPMLARLFRLDVGYRIMSFQYRFFAAMQWEGLRRQRQLRWCSSYDSELDNLFDGLIVRGCRHSMDG